MYHQVRLGLTRPQIVKVLKGGNIQIAHHKIGRGHMFHLTRAQHSKLARHHAAGKGMRLHFDHSQIRHHMKHGSGFLDFLKGAARTILKPLLHGAVMVGTNMIPGGAVMAASMAGHTAIDALGNKLGFGLRGRRRRRRVGMGVRRRRRVAGGSFRTIGSRRTLGGSFRPMGGFP